MRHQGIGAAVLCAVGAVAAASARGAGAPAKVSPGVQATMDGLTALRNYFAAIEAQKQELLVDAPDLVLADAPDRILSVASRLSPSGTHPGSRDVDDLLTALANNPNAPPLSRYGGMTRASPSVAWCGANAVIAYQDSSSTAASVWGKPSPSASHSWSRQSFASSHDAGRTFTGGTPLVADPLPAGIQFHHLWGDPAVGCSNPNRFYVAMTGGVVKPYDPVRDYSELGESVTVSISSDGGRTFSRTVQAAFPVPGWVEGNTVQPGGIVEDVQLHVTPGPAGDVVHVTYRVDDWSGDHCPLLPPARRGGKPRKQFRQVIGYVSSQDGGETWSAPVSAFESCWQYGTARLFPTSGSPRITARGNDVYVAWENFIARGAGSVTYLDRRTIQIAHSGDRGATFGAPTTISDVTLAGEGWSLQGDFRAFVDFNGLAIDRSSGALYVSWHDGRNLQIPEPFGWPSDKYGFADVLLSRSVDGGATWSAPVRVNDDPVGSAVDHFWPALAVDGAGNVVVVFADRRLDPRNFLIDVFLATSADGGRSFVNRRVSKHSFPPMTALQDILAPSGFGSDYLGDHFSVAVDRTGTSSGAIAAWGDTSLGNLNVEFAKKSFDDDGSGRQEISQSNSTHRSNDRGNP
jgi:hypothetical protein